MELLKPEHLAQAQTVTDESIALAAQCEQVVIQNEAQYTEAADILMEIKTRAKAVEVTRTNITKPLLAAKREIDKLFKAPAQHFKKAETGIKMGMLTYKREMEEKARRLEEEARALAQKENATVTEVREALIQATTETEAPKVSGIVTRKVMRFQIEDESKLPREFLKPDEAKIKAAVKAGIAVSGVHVWQEEEISARSK